MVMLWDVSSTQGVFTTDQVQLFLQYVITNIYPKVSATGSRIALIACGSTTELIFNFTRYSEPRDLITAINAYVPPAESATVTRLSEALQIITDDLYSNTTEVKHRAVLLLSQGLRLDDEEACLASSLSLRQQRVNMIGIGLPAPASDFGYLYSMVNKPATSYVSVVETFTELERRVSTVTSVLKNQGWCKQAI